jgi:hypothetical protein
MSMRAMLKYLLAAAILFTLSNPMPADDPEAKVRDESAKANEAVAGAKQRLNQLKQLAASGAIGSLNLDRAEIDLAETQIRLAIIERNNRDLFDSLSALVTVRENRWQQLKQAATSGAVARPSVNNARIELALTRMRLELHTIVAIREQELVDLQEAARGGLVSQRRVEEVRKDLEKARGRLQRHLATAVVTHATATK